MPTDRTPRRGRPAGETLPPPDRSVIHEWIAEDYDTVTAAAATLKCSREHLSRVLSDDRPAPAGPRIRRKLWRAMLAAPNGDAFAARTTPGTRAELDTLRV